MGQKQSTRIFNIKGDLKNGYCYKCNTKICSENNSDNCSCYNIKNNNLDELIPLR